MVDNWQRLLAETTDPHEREFYEAIHKLEPSVEVEWTDEGPIFIGIALKES